ncbi:ANTAR domain-containing protein [Streptomyces spectabilis]|uniref:ANTAR domain-containing protein n=1 Tax=Streptomyces spectabilis TaxID=68270 RepID=A0A516R2B8_STRST|nr:ANTAR domain-containing protein [Streptomyces spectabilis]QDQ09804.1 ANTAR domain-containing protein [Streptomyces spectabilis]
MPEDEECAGRLAALQEEVAQLRRAVDSHAVVDQAIGIVMACGGTRPETAWELLREVSQNTNIKLREIAEHLVRWPRCGGLPEEVRLALGAALRRREVGGGRIRVRAGLREELREAHREGPRETTSACAPR